MPIRNDGELRDVQGIVQMMYRDTVEVFRGIRENAKWLFGDRAPAIVDALDEFFRDFIDRPTEAVDAEVLISLTPAADFQAAGLYGAQLALKRARVTEANESVRRGLLGRAKDFFIGRPFKRWVEIINAFLGSLVAATGAGEALKELKDILAGELDDKA